MKNFHRNYIEIIIWENYTYFLYKLINVVRNLISLFIKKFRQNVNRFRVAAYIYYKRPLVANKLNTSASQNCSYVKEGPVLSSVRPTWQDPHPVPCTALGEHICFTYYLELQKLSGQMFTWNKRSKQTFNNTYKTISTATNNSYHSPSELLFISTPT